jgi:putative DNA primase/helicase
MWRRITVIPWSVTIPEEQQDKQLRERLLEELPGILAWVIERARLYLESGLPKLDTLTEVNHALRESCDDLGRWMETHIQFDPQFRIQSSDLYENFRLWSQAEGNTDLMSQRTLRSASSIRALTQKRIRGYMFWLNLCLREEARDRVGEEACPGLGGAPVRVEVPTELTTVSTSGAVPLQTVLNRLPGGSLTI